MKELYVIDACALIDAAKNYNLAKTTFSSIWETLDDMVSHGELISTAEVFDELKDDDLNEWAKKRKEMFLPVEKDVQDRVVQILKAYPTMIQIKSTSNSNADPFLIATAQLTGGCVVTNERLGDEKSGVYHIPNVCRGLNIPWIDLRTFLDRILQ